MTTYELRVVEEADSTNEVLLRADLKDYPPGTALMAYRQSAGRGRASRQWVSAPGGLYMSLLFVPPSLDALALWGAYCTVELCRERFGVTDLVIRWPNDVYHRGRKLAGILPQVKFLGATVERVVLGVGLNVSQERNDFPPELQDQVTTLLELTGTRWDTVEVAQALLDRFYWEIDLLRAAGRVSEHCLPLLEGYERSREVFAVEESGARRSLGRIQGLGPKGELLTDHGVLENLGPTERLRFAEE